MSEYIIDLFVSRIFFYKNLRNRRRLKFRTKFGYSEKTQKLTRDKNLTYALYSSSTERFPKTKIENPTRQFFNSLFTNLIIFRSKNCHQNPLFNPKPSKNQTRYKKKIQQAAKKNSISHNIEYRKSENSIFKLNI